MIAPEDYFLECLQCNELQYTRF